MSVQLLFRRVLPAMPQAQSTAPTRPQYRLAALLRRQASEACDALSSCPLAGVSYTHARLRALREILTLAISCEGLIPDDERERTDRQLLHPATVKDWLAAVEIVIQTQRSPAYLTSHAAELQTISRKLDVLFAALSKRPGFIPAWDSLRAESEVAS